MTKKEVAFGIALPILVIVATWEAGRQWAWYQPLSGLITGLFEIATTPVKLPAWALLACAAIAVCIGYLITHLRKSKKKINIDHSAILEVETGRSASDSELERIVASIPLSSPLTLSVLEENVLRILIAADGAWMTIDSLQQHTKDKRLLLEKAISKMLRLHLIKSRLNALDGPSYRAADSGVAFAQKQGWL